MLIDEVKVPLNRVIDFARLKFGSIKDLLKGFLLRFPNLSEEEAAIVANKLLSHGKGYIVIYLQGIDEESSREHLIYIDTKSPVEILASVLKEGFNSLDLEPIKQGKILGAGIGFKKV
ncbi:MAG: hypothetical protein PHH06_01265 [Candidatus Gracilibacteria bacterium]|nr:hypothetical protein [Candidatus Gracilibacteria bacterium]